MKVCTIQDEIPFQFWILFLAEKKLIVPGDNCRGKGRLSRFWFTEEPVVPLEINPRSHYFPSPSTLSGCRLIYQCIVNLRSITNQVFRASVSLN